MEASPVLDVAGQRRETLRKLIDVSHDTPMDFATAVAWEIGVDRSRPPKAVDQSWVFGTPYFDALTEEQRMTHLWLENARDVSMFIALEQVIPVLYVGYLNQHESRLSKDIYEYLMIFAKEEIVHTLVFKRYLQAAGLPQFERDPSVNFALGELRSQPPVAGILFTLVIEWMAELGAMFGTQSDEVDPLTRAMFLRHHHDEARHIAFARWIVEAHCARADEAQLAPLRQMVQHQIRRLLPAYSYAPVIARYLPFPAAAAPDEPERIRAIQDSSANTALNRERFAPMMTWMAKLGLT